MVAPHRHRFRCAPPRHRAGWSAAPRRSGWRRRGHPPRRGSRPPARRCRSPAPRSRAAAGRSPRRGPASAHETAHRSARSAGMSCAWPSVSAITPASRARGISASARSVAVNSRVPWLPASGTSTVRSSRSGRRPARASISAPRRLDLRGARADARGIAAVHHQQRDVGAGLARLLDQPGVRQGQQQHGEGHRPPRPRRAPAATPPAPAPAAPAAERSAPAARAAGQARSRCRRRCGSSGRPIGGTAARRRGGTNPAHGHGEGRRPSPDLAPPKAEGPLDTVNLWWARRCCRGDRAQDAPRPAPGTGVQRPRAFGGEGPGGAKPLPPVRRPAQFPSLSRIAGTCTWSPL